MPTLNDRICCLVFINKEIVNKNLFDKKSQKFYQASKLYAGGIGSRSNYSYSI